MLKNARSDLDILEAAIAMVSDSAQQSNIATLIHEARMLIDAVQTECRA
jgi:hypothetical protein